MTTKKKHTKERREGTEVSSLVLFSEIVHVIMTEVAIRTGAEIIHKLGSK